MKKLFNQSGIIHTLPLLIIVASVGIISFLLISSTLPLNGLFGILNPKPSSHAAGTLTVTGVAADHSAAKIYFNPVAGAKDYRIYDVTNPNNVKYGGLIRLTPGGECPGYVCNTHFVMQADGVTPVFPYQIASGASGGPQFLDVPQVQIDYNGLGDGQPHTLVVEAVDKLGPVPHANLYDGFNLALNIPFVSPLPASAMLGGNKGPSDDGKISTNGQGPYTNNPQVIAQSQPFRVQANRSYQAIPSKSSATQTFFDTFEDSQTSTLTQTARNDNYTDSFGTLGLMDFTLNSGTPKAWNIMIRSANNRDTMPFISSDHFMDVLFDGATPGVAAPTHTIYGNLSMIPSPNIDISNGKVLHLTTELDGHNSFRRWWAFNLAPAANPLRRFDFHNGAISNTNQGLFLEFRDFDCELSIFTGPVSTTSAPTSTGSIPFNCDRNHLFLNKNLTHNGIGLDNKSRFDLYLSQTHLALFQDGQFIAQSDIPAGSFPWANQPLKAYFTHYLYHSDVDDDDVRSFELNQQPMCYPLNSYWFNDPVRGTTAASNVCNLTYPPGYGFPYSDERHWDNMGFEVLPASDVPANNDFTAFSSLVQTPAIQAPQFTTGVSPTPVSSPTPTAIPTPTPTPKPSTTPTPAPVGKVVTLSINPATVSISTSQTTTLSLVMDTKTDQVTAADIHLNFDPSKLQVQSITPNSPVPWVEVFSPGPVFDNTAGTASVTLGSGSTPVTGTVTMATVVFKALNSTGTTAVNYAATTLTASVGKTGTSLGTTSGSTVTITLACPKAALGDVNCDGTINIFDYNILITNFNKTGTGIAGDINNSGKVDIFDYNIIVTNFGQ